MFGRPKPVVFDPYGGRRKRRGVPRWLVLLLGGAVLGAGGVLFVQERYLPPRLSAAEGAALRGDFERADGERERLAAELAHAAKQLDAALAEKKTLADGLAASRQAVEQLRADVSALAAVLPPDPRGGAVQVRAARFSAEEGQLLYEVVLSRERTGGKPLPGVMQLVVAGTPARGPETSVTLQPVSLSLGNVETVRGGLPLPEGFTPRQTKVNVFDRVGGKLLGTRVINVR